MLNRWLILGTLFVVLWAPRAWSQTPSQNAEARALFERGNDFFEQARASRGEQREQLLRRALTQYVASLRITRSRNALYNAAVVSEDLGRPADAYNYLTEYLRVGDVEGTDADEANARKNALRSKVGLLAIQSTPLGSEVRLDRRDLARVGTTPATIAVTPGKHEIFVGARGYKEGRVSVDIEPGEEETVDLTLRALPVDITVVVRGEGALFLNGKPASGNAPLSVEPGDHLLRLQKGQRATRRTLVVQAGEPQTIYLSLPAEDPQRPNMALRNGAIATGAASLALAGVGVGLAFRARNLRDDYNDAAARFQMTLLSVDRARAEALADDVDRANITADAMFGLSGAAAVTGLILYLVHRKKYRRATNGREQTNQPTARPAWQLHSKQRGAMLHAAWTWGAP